MKRLLGLCGVCALAACSAPASIDSVSQGIINGTDDTGDPGVVMVLAQVPNSMNASLCTGEVVSPHVVLTAAHCVDPATVGAGAQFVVFTGQILSMTSPKSDFLTVQETHFNSSFNSSSPQNGNDVGVVILASPTTIAPLPYNRAPLPQSMVGGAMRIIGYGITSASDTTGTSAGTRRTAPDTLAALDKQFVYLQDGSHGICEGDSGGPALMTIGGEERIVGVTSFGYNGCPTTGPSAGGQTAYAGNDTRIDAYSDFIDQWVLMFDPPAKGPGAMCTSDSDCTPRACEQTSVGKICVQSCDPAAMPSTCPAGTMCTDVDGTNICATPMSSKGGKGGGCAIGGAGAPAGGALLLALLAVAALLSRRRAEPGPLA